MTARTVARSTLQDALTRRENEEEMDDNISLTSTDVPEVPENHV